MSYKKFTVLILALSISFLSFAPIVRAQLAVPVSDNAIIQKEVGALKLFGFTIPGTSWDSIVLTIAKATISRLVNSTVKWINNGFDGNPAYVNNPKQYFTDIADGMAGEFIRGSDLGLLCSPFQANIRLSLMQEYYEPLPYQCTLSEVTSNIEGFFDDFSQGGWDAWFSMTQNPTNNPYGAYLKARVDMDSRIASAVGLKNNELDRGRGFLSFEKCPPGSLEGTSEELEKGCFNADTGEKVDATVVTPGSVIETQLSNTLGSNLRQLELVDEFDELIASLTTQLLQKIFSSGDGLAGAANTSETDPIGQTKRPKPVDIDGDGVIDGTDTNGDGSPDICLFGGENDTIGPPCLGSGDAGQSGEGSGSQCSVSGEQYDRALRDAESAVIAENPDVAALPNIEEGGRQNARTFLGLVAAKLQSSGFNATTDVLNGHNNPNTGDLIALWKSGDTLMERYDAIIGGASTIGGAATAEFVGFVPLNCTTSGGGKDCGGCDNGGTPTGPLPSPSPSPAPAPGQFGISSVTPTVAQAGVTTITISGTALTNQISFYDGSGNRNTVVGTVNSAKTQTTVLVPANQPVGNATVKIYQGNQVWSNGILIQVTNTGVGTLSTISPTSTWMPPQTTNGWWPSLSPDGRYVTYGNWGESWVTDLESSTKQTWDFSKPNGLPSGARCIAGQWLSSTKMTFVCEVAANSTFWRYEVTVGDWTPVKTNDDPSLVAGNIFSVKDGHWASYLASNPSRLAKDNQILATGTGGAIALSGNTLVHSCTNDGTSVCVREGSSLTKSYSAKTPIHNMTTSGGYIAYGGYGPVRGITPLGQDIDLTASPWRRENTGDMTLVSGTLWVTTTSWDNQDNNYILLRPWGSLSVIAVSAPATSISVRQKNGNFIIAYNDNKGRMSVITIPVSSQRNPL